MLTPQDFARFAAGTITSFAAPSLAASVSTVTIHPLISNHVSGELPVALYLLLLLPHGGNGSEQDLPYFKAVIDAEILAGRLSPLVIGTPGARRSLYMDYRDGL
ncbi:hypothetical protein [Parasphingorhabdus sp.]|uniref:hypothetical protein n=1 Tax=Parasphingorhabdus sp. TaxID=2709688 RepID=UPI003A90DC66